jgi:hypothetical protein
MLEDLEAKDEIEAAFELDHTVADIGCDHLVIRADWGPLQLLSGKVKTYVNATWGTLLPREGGLAPGTDVQNAHPR